MNISLVMGVLNKLELTKECYKKIRIQYPDVPLIISSGGSNDGTYDWLQSLDDNFLSFIHNDERVTFSETYNAGINLVDTDKLILIHNDMVLGEGFVENIDKLLTEDMLLSYTTVEPPIFKDHNRPGKIIKDFGDGFENFNSTEFNEFIKTYNKDETLYYGCSFFTSGYKKIFTDTPFDGFSFFPAFCEDDDFLIRCKIKGVKLNFTYRSIAYHFVSQTSRFGDDYKDNREKIEMNSNKNFIRKWGIPSYIFTQIRYWEDPVFTYPIFQMGVEVMDASIIPLIEPFFDKINVTEIPYYYINEEQKNTNYHLPSKFTFSNVVDVMVYQISEFTNYDYQTLQMLRLSIPHYEPGEYVIGCFKIEIIKKL